MRFFIGLACLLVFISIGAWFAYYAQQPNQGSVTVGQAIGRATDEQSAIKGERVRHEAQAFSFSYPTKFAIENAEEVQRGGVILEHINLHWSSGAVSEKIALTRERLPLGGLPEHPSVQFRRMHPDIYQEEVFLSEKKNGVLFIKKDDLAEVTVFLAYTEELIIISHTGSTSDVESLRPELSRIAESIEWRNSAKITD